MTEIQTNLPVEDAFLRSTYVIDVRANFDRTVFAAITKTVSTSSIRPAVSRYAPNLDPALLINSSVTELRHVVPSEYLESAVLAYNLSINHAFVSSSQPDLSLSIY